MDIYFVLEYDCTCTYTDCKLVTHEERKELFTDFWKLGDFDAQNFNIVQNITVLPKKSQVLLQSNDKKRRPKTNTRRYFLNKKRVCKEVFLHTFGISSGRLDRVLKKKGDGQIMAKDARGKHGKQYKVSDEVADDLRNFIAKIPKYKSHYKDQAEERYLAPGIKKVNVYEMWKENSETKFQNPKRQFPTYEWFLGFWKREFKLKVHSPSRDCCSTCDELKRSGKEDELKVHHKNAKTARNLFKEDAQKPYTVSFDMEKTQPLPHIETNKVFYLRQLWLYNEGFNHTSTNTGYMYVWTENVAKRGSIEVGSCLLQFVRNVANDWPELVLWSDSCGGQNRNLNMVALMIALVNSNNSIKKITHRFLWSGHSYLPNDSDFSHKEEKHHRNFLSRRVH